MDHNLFLDWPEKIYFYKSHYYFKEYIIKNCSCHNAFLLNLFEEKLCSTDEEIQCAIQGVYDFYNSDFYKYDCVKLCPVIINFKENLFLNFTSERHILFVFKIIPEFIFCSMYRLSVIQLILKQFLRILITQVENILKF